MSYRALDMKNIFFIICLLSCMVFTLLASAQDYDENQIPPGMELIEVGTTRLVVPEDAEVREEAGVIVVESIDKYVARNIAAIKTQVLTIETHQQELDEQIEQLKKIVDEMQKDETFLKEQQ